MRVKSDTDSGNGNNTLTGIPFFVGLFVGLGFSAVGAAIFIMSNNSISENKDISSDVEISKSSKDSSCSLDNTKNASTSEGHRVFKKALLAARTMRAQEETPRVEPRGFKQQDAERKGELAVLKEALPGNLLVPGKTQEELRQISENIQDDRNIRALIIDGEASDNDLKDYFDLKAKRFHDEIAVLDFCEAQASRDPPLAFCLDIEVSDTTARRNVAEASLAALQNAYRNGFDGVRKTEEAPERIAARQVSKDPGNPETSEAPKQTGVDETRPR